jgi:hypothetical protein
LLLATPLLPAFLLLAIALRLAIALTLAIALRLAALRLPTGVAVFGVAATGPIISRLLCRGRLATAALLSIRLFTVWLSAAAAFACGATPLS